MNNQKPTKQDLDRDGINKPLLINNIFYTIQGEGPFSGQPAVFVRLSGCNLQCTWCDTQYGTNSVMLISHVTLKILEVCRHRRPLIVITGGEPFNQNISGLCRSLVVDGFPVQVETNGVLSNPEFPWEDVSVVVSPKTKFIHPDIKKYARYYKYVIQEKDKTGSCGFPNTKTQPNGGGIPQPAPGHIESKNIFLSPLDSKNEARNSLNQQKVVELCMRFGYTVSLQTHKILNIE